MAACADDVVHQLAAVGKRAPATRRGCGRVRDVEYLERLGRSRALHYVSEAVPDPDSVAAARVNGARVGKVALACQNRGRRVGYVEDLERVGRSRALSDVGVVARDEYAIVRDPIIQVGRALKDRRRRVRHIEDVEAFISDPPIAI